MPKNLGDIKEVLELLAWFLCSILAVFAGLRKAIKRYIVSVVKQEINPAQIIENTIAIDSSVQIVAMELIKIRKKLDDLQIEVAHMDGWIDAQKGEK